MQQHSHFHLKKSKDELTPQSPACGTSPTPVNVPRTYPEFIAAFDQHIQTTSGERLVSRNRAASPRDKNGAMPKLGTIKIPSYSLGWYANWLGDVAERKERRLFC
jgi:hypothetical protein